MEKIDIVLWIISSGFGFFFALMLVMWTSINSRFEKIDERLEKIETQMNNIDKRLYAVECMIHMQDCCVMKEDKQLKRAE